MNQKIQDYVSSGIAVVIAKGVSLFSVFSIVWLLNQILGKELYGVYAPGLALIQLAAIFGLAGLDQTILYRLSRRNIETGVLAGGGFVVSVLIFTVPLSLVIAGSLSVVGVYGNWGIWNDNRVESLLLIFLAAAIPLINTQKIFAAWYQARHRVTEAVLVPTSLNVSRALLLGMTFILWPTLKGVVLGVMISFAVPVLFWILITPLKHFTVREALARQDYSYGFKLAIASLAGRGMKSVNILMVGLLSTAAYTAEYAVAVQLSVIMYLGNNLFRPIFTPRLGRLLAHQNNVALEREFGQNRLIALFTAVAMAIIFIGFGEEILSLFGNYKSAYPTLMVIIATTIITVGFGANGQYLNMAGYAGWSLLVLIALLLFCIGLNLYLIPKFGGLGAALASFLSFGFLNALSAWLIWYLDRVPTLNLSVILTMLITNGTILAIAFLDFDRTIACTLIFAALSTLLFFEKKLWYPFAKHLTELAKK